MGIKLIASNKKAFHDYFIDEVVEAGLVLQGTEVKSLRLGHVSLKEAYCRIRNGEIYVENMHILPYEQASRENHDPLRPRKLLLHASEIAKLTTGVRGGRAFNSISGALPLIPETGLPHPPLGYDVPSGSYRIRVSNPVDSNIVISARTDSLSISYSRSGAGSGDRDELWYDGGVGVRNPDAAQKRVNLQVLAWNDSSERTANINGLPVGQNDSVSAAQDPQSRPKLVNYGPAKSYQLQLRNSSLRGLRRFQSATLNVPAQSAHIFAPRWDSLASAVLRIYVDLGNNGTIDDTLRIANTASCPSLTESCRRAPPATIVSGAPGMSRSGGAAAASYGRQHDDDLVDALVQREQPDGPAEDRLSADRQQLFRHAGPEARPPAAGGHDGHYTHVS